MKQFKEFIKLLLSDSDAASTKRVMSWVAFMWLMAVTYRGIFHLLPAQNEAVLLYTVEVFAWLIAGLLGLTSIDKLPKGLGYVKELIKFRKKDEPAPEPEPAPIPVIPDVKPEVNILEAKLRNILPPLGQKFVPYLADSMHTAQITTPLRIAHFISQLSHESGEFKFTKEIWGPTAAQKRYEGRKDLGNVIPGDGKKFLGRGLIQVTGRSNYVKCSTALFGDDRLIHSPELLEQPEFAAKSAVWYWQSRNLNDVADSGAMYSNVQAVTKIINGGSNGLRDRWAKFQVIYQKVSTG